MQDQAPDIFDNFSITSNTFISFIKLIFLFNIQACHSYLIKVPKTVGVFK